jgi:hypothetical protein
MRVARESAVVRYGAELGDARQGDRAVWLRRAARLQALGSTSLLVGAAFASMIALVAGELLLPVNVSCWAVIGVLLLGVLAIALTESGCPRLVAVNLFAVAMAVRLIALVGFTAVALREGGPFLGPDSTGYLEGATQLVQRGFHLDAPAVVFFGTYDVAHYYVFAAAMRYLHADLFGLQLLNAGSTAFAAPLIYSIARRVIPAAARPVGLLVAIYPSLIALSTVDLLKDPSIVCATLLAIWTIVRLADARRPAAIAAISAAGACALLYLRTGRFYTFAYLEAAAAAASAWLFTVRRRRPDLRWTSAIALVLTFSFAEIAPTQAGWPTTPVLFASQVAHVLGTPEMFNYSRGLVERFARRHAPENEPAGISLVSAAANLVRRTLGPYPWVLPEHWNFRYLQSGDFLLYPSMITWYALLPFTLLGFISIGRRLYLRERVGFARLFLWVFATVYFLQYLLINLSYRQREAMMPVLTLFAAVGVLRALRLARFNRWYGAYWGGLIIMAAGHLAFRAAT